MDSSNDTVSESDAGSYDEEGEEEAKSEQSVLELSDEIASNTDKYNLSGKVKSGPPTPILGGTSKAPIDAKVEENKEKVMEDEEAKDKLVEDELRTQALRAAFISESAPSLAAIGKVYGSDPLPSTAIKESKPNLANLSPPEGDEALKMDASKQSINSSQLSVAHKLERELA